MDPVGTAQAGRRSGHDRGAGGGRRQERPEGERRRSAEERHLRVPAPPDSAIELEGDHVAAPEGTHQLDHDHRAR